MGTPEQPTPSQATEPEELEQPDNLEQQQRAEAELKNIFEQPTHPVSLPSCGLQITRVIQGQIIQQISIQGSGFNKIEAAELFNHALQYMEGVLKAMDEKKK